MLRFSALQNRFVRDLEDEQASAVRWLRSEAARLEKAGNAEARFFANALAAEIERCGLLEKLICEIPLPEAKKKRGRPLSIYKRKAGRPIEWTRERYNTLLAFRNIGRKLVEKDRGPGARISDPAALKALLLSRGKPIGRLEKRQIRAFAKVLSAMRRSVRKLTG
jgi:hypothetical protein